MSVTFSLKGIESNFETGEDCANFSNYNANTVISLLQIPLNDGRTLHGEITNLDTVIRQGFQALNNSRKDYGEDEFVDGRYTQFEITDESVRRRIKDMMTLCVKAKQLGTTVIFG